ncbi:endonuclease III domain-containing protein [Thermodesulfobacteriota bacterium]
MLSRSEYKTLRNCVEVLNKYGEETGPFLPWHFSKDEFDWLIAESLLRRTTRTAAEKAYSSLVQKYPSWKSLVKASTAEIKSIIGWIGLGHQRSVQIKKLSENIIYQHKGKPPKNKEAILALPGIGEYIADAIMLYVNKRKFFPIDPNIQRIVRRNLNRPTPIGTRHSTPYSDQVLNRFSSYVLKKLTVQQLLNLHRGMLLASWEFCRPKPNCRKCLLNENCRYAKDSIS